MIDIGRKDNNRDIIKIGMGFDLFAEFAAIHTGNPVIQYNKIWMKVFNQWHYRITLGRAFYLELFIGKGFMNYIQYILVIIQYQNTLCHHNILKSTGRKRYK